MKNNLENENWKMNNSTIRPTKKQKLLLEFIAAFIAEHGYSPSYREIMTGLNYTSVATVALHVNSLITRGHLRKRDRSARSIEVVQTGDKPSLSTNQISAGQEKWLVQKVQHFFAQAEQTSVLPQNKLDELYVLIGALKVLGLDGAAQSFIPRLTNLKRKHETK